MRHIGVADEGVELMAPAAAGKMVRVSGLSPREANILKQEALSLGGDAALPAEAYAMAGAECEALLMGTLARLEALAARLELFSGSLASLGKDLAASVFNYSQAFREMKLPEGLGGRPWQVMGILNVTPDSFYDGGRHQGPEAALVQARLMAGAGAGIIDVGGESTKPGSAPVSEDEEISRVLPVIEAIASELDVVISVDTSKSGVARAALDAGAAMINDVTGLRNDEEMVAVAAEYRCPVCIMHMQGTPADMQEAPAYDDVVAELVEFFQAAIERAAAKGVARENIILDPGIGFGKKLKHNLRLLKHLDSFLSLGRPLMIGVSRKSFIGMIMDNGAEERLAGTLAANVAAFQKGARIFRVHDVAENYQALKTIEAVEAES